MTRKKILLYEIIGVIIIPIFVLGLYKGVAGYTTQYPLTIFFANETLSWSTYLRIGFWGAALFAFIQYFFIGKKTNNFLLAKAISILIFLSLMSFLYTLYGILGIHFLNVDITTLIIMAAIAQHVSSRFLAYQKHFPTYNTLAIVLIAALITIFIIQSHL